MNTRTTPHRRGRSLVALAVGVVLAAAACGSDDDGATSTDPPATTEEAAPAATEAPATTEAATGDVAERIVSLSPTHTEMLFAIDAGDQVVAVDMFSNYPPEALELPNDLSGFEPNVEAIAEYEPDLVVIGGDFTGLGEQLDSIGIDSWDGPAPPDLDGTYAQIQELGVLTGNVAEAEALVAEMQADIDQIVADTEVPDEGLTYYHELDPTYFSVTSNTFIGELYTLLGLENIADPAEGDSGGFPQLNAEFIVAADPDLIFLADTKCCAESAETVGARDGWAGMTAVVNGNVIEMDDDIASRWGPRVVDYLQAVSIAVEQALVPA